MRTSKQQYRVAVAIESLVANRVQITWKSEMVTGLAKAKALASYRSVSAPPRLAQVDDGSQVVARYYDGKPARQR